MTPILRALEITLALALLVPIAIACALLGLADRISAKH
jgi:hypothetical protein